MHIFSAIFLQLFLLNKHTRENNFHFPSLHFSWESFSRLTFPTIKGSCSVKGNSYHPFICLMGNPLTFCSVKSRVILWRYFWGLFWTMWCVKYIFGVIFNGSNFKLQTTKCVQTHHTVKKKRPKKPSIVLLFKNYYPMLSLCDVYS